MTATTRKLGRRQVDVLRAAAAGTLVRFDDGGWSAASTACTQAAKSVAKRGLLAADGRMIEYTFGVAKGRPGARMGLSADGEQVLQEWELANAPAVIAHLRHAAAIRELSAKPGETLGQDLVTLAARDEALADNAWNVISRAVDGRPVIDDNQEA